MSVRVTARVGPGARARVDSEPSGRVVVGGGVRVNINTKACGVVGFEART